MGLNASALTTIRTILAETKPGAEEPFLERILRVAAMWRSQLLANSIIVQYGRRVQSGPFEGMDYVVNASEGSLLPRLIGSYESELHPHILALAAEGLDQVIDVGCAEGYYAVGLARLMPEVTVHAFDIDPVARTWCAALAEKNEVADRVRIGEAFAGEDFARYENSRTLVFMDIEGGERILLDPDKWPALRTLPIIVETHGGPKFAIAEELTRRFEGSHDIIRVYQGGKTGPMPPLIASLGHLDQLIAIWEWRRYPTPWLVMRPKAGAA
jgi:hypothetical protein